MNKEKYSSRLFLHFLCPLLLIMWSIGSTAQSEITKTGDWTGVLEIPGFELELNIHLKNENGNWSGLLDIPAQGIEDMSLVNLTITNDSIRFKLPEVPGNASFAGAFSEPALLAGIFSQGGQSLDIKFEREDEAAKKAEKERLEKIVVQLGLLADSIIENHNLPGLSFGIIKDGEIVMTKGFGLRDVENKIPVTSNTLFAIGSCSKAFTAMDLAMLMEEGNLEWDKPVVEYMPDFKLYDDFATAEMNTVDLLSHQSGLPRHDMMWYGSPLDRYELYSRLQYLPPTESFRSTWQYQNLMFMTAGILVEKLSNKSWESFTQERILDPLKMNKTLFSWENVGDDADVSLGYTQEEDALKLTPYRNIENVGPAGSIISNVNDMLEWVEFLLDSGKANGQELVKPETIEFIQQPHKTIENSESASRPSFSAASYGLGWGVGYYKGTKLVSHGGGIDGYSAYVTMLPRENIGIVSLCNAGGAGGINTVMSRTAIDLLIENEEIDWYARVFGDSSEQEEEEEEESEEVKNKEPVPDTSPSHTLADYTGEYEHPGYGVATVSIKNDSLHLKYNAFDQTISHWHYDVFNLDVPEAGMNMLISFHTNADGFVDQLSAFLEPALDRAFYFEKLPPNLMSDTYLANVLGEYVLDANETKVKLAKKGEKLFITITGQPPYELEAYQEDEYKLTALSGYTVKFYFEEEGEAANRLEFLQPNGIFGASRKKDD